MAQPKKAQDYNSHRRLIPMYHYVTLLATIALVIGSFVNLFKTLCCGQGLYSASLITLIAVILFMQFWFIRGFALKAQDRAIKTEVNLRHYVLTGKMLDTKLSVRQIIALRFAPDEELPELSAKAATHNMTPNDIKKEIKNWLADHYRV